MLRRLLAAFLLIPSLAWGASTPTSVDVSWTAPTTNADATFTPLTDLAGYRLYLSTPCPSQQYAIVPSPTAAPGPGEIVGVTVNGLMPSTTYTARVTAVDFSGNESVCSALATGATTAAVPPSPATNLRLSFGQEPPPGMNATLDAISAPAGVNATSLTFAHTCSGLNRALAVVVGTNNATGATGVTYAGVAMALEITLTIPNNDTIEIWTLANPAPGANNVVVTVASIRDITAGGISARDVDQLDVSRASASAQGTDAAPTVNVASVSGDLVISGVLTDTNVTHAPGTDETEQWDTINASGMRVSGTTESPAGTTTTMSRTLGSVADWGIVSMSFRGAASAQVSYSKFPKPKLAFADAMAAF